MGHLPLEISPKGICLVQQLVSVAALKPDLVRGDEQRGHNEGFCDQSHLGPASAAQDCPQIRRPNSKGFTSIHNPTKAATFDALSVGPVPIPNAEPSFPKIRAR
jgi:hypothetical protein